MTKGTTPVGAANEAEASRWVREMFGRIAPRYDLLNHLLSFNIDRLWRRRLIRRVRPILDNPSARVLDLCCGPGEDLRQRFCASDADGRESEVARDVAPV